MTGLANRLRRLERRKSGDLASLTDAQLASWTLELMEAVRLTDPAEWPDAVTRHARALAYPADLPTEELWPLIRSDLAEAAGDAVVSMERRREILGIR